MKRSPNHPLAFQKPPTWQSYFPGPIVLFRKGIGRLQTAIVAFPGGNVRLQKCSGQLPGSNGCFQKSIGALLGSKGRHGKSIEGFRGILKTVNSTFYSSIRLKFKKSLQSNTREIREWSKPIHQNFLLILILPLTIHYSSLTFTCPFHPFSYFAPA